jgi:hypothetical protein
VSDGRIILNNGVVDFLKKQQQTGFNIKTTLLRLFKELF